MYVKEFEIRWSDLDANRHLANSAYVNFMGHTRMSFLTELGLSHLQLKEHGLGPVVFYEHIYYFREIFPGPPVQVSLKVAGLSEDGCFFEFHHDVYNHKGIHMAHCEMMGAWIDLTSRKLTALPNDLMELFDKVERPEGFRTLTKADTRKYSKKPKDLV